jgi:alkylation response protein AidB-like acyl-CoA dehydrogenase
MDFSLSEEQQILADSIGRWLAADYDFEARRSFSVRPAGFAEENWQRLAELGLLGLNVPTAHGGSEGSTADIFIVMRAFGRALVLEPYLSTAVVGASLIGSAGTLDQKRSILPGVVEGSRRIALAALEPGARFDFHDVRTTARRRGEGYVINGKKAVVLHGDSADTLIVSARTSGASTDENGLSLFLIDSETAGVRVRSFPSIDGQRTAEIELTSVKVAREAVLGELDAGFPVLELGVERGLAALCAEALGAMESLMDLTAQYLRTRKQFGQPIGAFQALQHRVADMLIAIEQARSMALLAVAKVDDPNPRERRKAIAAAKAMSGRCGRYVGQQAVQLHGGMGMSDELAVGHYFKRLTCIDLTWGDAAHHLERYSDLVC